MSNQAIQRRQRAFAGAALVVGSVFTIALCAICTTTVLPPSALHLSRANERFVSQTFPQGWKFFTKDPLSVEFFVYRQEADRWMSMTAPPMASRENLWGLDRVIRTQGLEIASLLGEAEETLRWSECDDAIDHCAAIAGPGPLLRNRAPAPTVCGDIAVTREQPVPWAWRHLRSRMPRSITRARVQCSNG